MASRNSAATRPTAGDHMQKKPFMTTSSHTFPPYPAFGICGFSNSGKTTLIMSLVARLRQRGLKVGVIKQDAHGLDIDRKGKDTDRLFHAGADVLIRDHEQVFFRLHRPENTDLHHVIEQIGPHYDVILVEGHKSTPLPWKVWLHKPGEDTCPPEAVGIRQALRWTEDRERIVWELLERWITESWLATPVYAGILIGGSSTRMGRPKHLIEEKGISWIQKTVTALQGCADKILILGNGERPEPLRSLPVLPDVDDARGPLRGMRAALRWAPRAGWLLLACDQPYISTDAIHWVLAQRQPGVRAIMPVVTEASPPEPLFAYYDFRMASAMEQVLQPRDLATVTGVRTPLVPTGFTRAWRNMNTPDDLLQI